MYPKILHTIVRDFYFRNKHNNYSIRYIATIFNISKSTVGRWIKNNYKSKKSKKKIDFTLQIIKNILIDYPFITLRNIQSILLNKYKYKSSLSEISRKIRLLGFSYKKVSKKFYGKNIKDLLLIQKKFKKTLSRIPNKNIICIDESCFMSNDSKRYGWSLIGSRLYNFSKSNPTKYNLLMAITQNGILDYEIYDQNINGEIFFNFIKNKILPRAENKFILMDNIGFHKSKKLLQLIKDNNSKPLFIPPYSPQFNSIEYVFNILKTKYRQLNNHSKSLDVIAKILNDENSNFKKIYKHVKNI